MSEERRIRFQSLNASDTQEASVPAPQILTQDRKQPTSGPRIHKKMKTTKVWAKFLWPEPMAMAEQERLKIISAMDWKILIATIILCVVGVVMITSSGYYSGYTYQGDAYFYLNKQLRNLAIGAAALLVGCFIPVKHYKWLASLIYAASLLLCVLVLFIGTKANNSSRWLNVWGFSFQPCEFAKLGVAMYLAALTESLGQKRVKKFGYFCLLILLLLIPTALVATENLSSALILFAIGIMVLFIGGARFLHIFLIGIIGLGGIFILTYVVPTYCDVSKFPAFLQKFFQTYRLERVIAFFDPTKYGDSLNYQAQQAKYALASGGLFGRGLGESIQKLGNIPEAHNDIIFAVICEELGLFGAGALCFLYTILCWRGFTTSAKAPGRFEASLCAGITTQILTQAVLNMSVSLGYIPVTGISLPFISYGGSSVMFLLFGVGILLNISRYSQGAKARGVRSER